MARDNTDDSEERSANLDRRNYLKLAGAAAASVGAAGVASNASAARDRVNIVDAGADPNGNDPIDGVLQRVVGDDVEVYFPEGTYRVNSARLSGSNYALVGDGAKLVPGDSGATMLHCSGHGWEVDGFEVDNTVTGRMPWIWVRSSGTDWTVRNVDVTGKVGGGGFRVFFASVRDSNATGRYENVTATHGSEYGTNAKTTSSVGCYYVSQHHVGTLTLDNVDVRNFWSRGIYHSGVSTGAVHIVNSYWENNRVNIRLAGNDCLVRNTTVKQTMNKPGPSYCIWLRANRQSPSEKVHAQAYNALIEDCDLIVDGTNSSNPPQQASAINGGTGHSNQYFGSFSVRNCRIRVEGANADAGVEAGPQSYPTANSGRPPEGVLVENSSIVTDGDTAGVAIDGRDDSVVRSNCIDAGGRTLDFTNSTVNTSDIAQGPCSLDGGSTQPDLPHTVTISGGGGGELLEYELSVSGDIEKSIAGGASIDPEDSISGSTATGGVAGGLDAYRCSGDITGFDATGDVTLTLDGQTIDAGSLPGVGESDSSTTDETTSDSSTTEETTTDSTTDETTNDSSTTDETTEETTQPTLSNVLTISGGSGSNLVEYELAVSGDLERSTAGGATIDSEDSVSGSTASGGVAGGTDAYRFSGDITGFDADADVTLHLNGLDIDASSLPSVEPDLPNTLVIDGGDRSSVSTYEFAVSGDAEKSAELGSINAYDTVSDGTITGRVVAGADAYRFSGDITGFRLDGSANVEMNTSE